DVFVRDVVRRVGDGAARSAAADDDERSLAGAGGAEDGAGAEIVADAAQNHTAGVDGDGPGDVVFAGGEQHGTAVAVGVQRQRGHGSDRRLDDLPGRADG